MRVFEGKYLDVFRRNDWEFSVRKNSSGNVGILAITDDLQIILIQQYREPLQKTCIEIPAGVVGDNGPESIVEAAQRELLEETGYSANSIRFLGDFVTSPGMSTETMSFVLATGLTKITDQVGVDQEKIKVIYLPVLAMPEKLLELNKDNHICATVFTALYFGHHEISKRIKDGLLSYKDVISSY